MHPWKIIRELETSDPIRKNKTNYSKFKIIKQNQETKIKIRDNERFAAILIVPKILSAFFVNSGFLLQALCHMRGDT